MRKRSISFILLVLIIGAAIGTALGELIAYIVPTGVVEQFFLRAALIGFEPFTLNLGVFTFTLGFTLELNVIGVIGIAISAYILRWYHSDRRY
ncbi:DUF4321 domain-containing protein [candidate division KSB1 bacterium]|nr:DUF4321 domain-containing protein [candidate division KSB1 bacterium]